MRPVVLAAITIALMAAVSANAETNLLAAYAGKYPFDKVGGVTFIAQPAVAAGVKKAVADKAVQGWVLNADTTAGPISVKGGKVQSWACEPHNCGDHEWTIVIDLASGATDVCYHDATTMKDGQARWYLASGKNEMRTGDCPPD